MSDVHSLQVGQPAETSASHGWAWREIPATWPIKSLKVRKLQLCGSPPKFCRVVPRGVLHLNPCGTHLGTHPVATSSLELAPGSAAIPASPPILQPAVDPRSQQLSPATFGSPPALHSKRDADEARRDDFPPHGVLLRRKQRGGPTVNCGILPASVNEARVEGR